MEKEFTAVQQFVNAVIQFFVEYSFSVLGAVIILIVGLWIANQVAALTARFMDKSKIDVTLTKFAAGFIRILITAFAVIIALGKFGITISPFIAAIGGAAFGASFALQGPLANYGAGLSIILSRPFVVGDTVKIQDHSGVVEDVRLALTILRTEDGERITIPNKHIVGEILVNSKAYRIVEGSIGISYSDDPERAIQAIREVLLTFAEIAKSPQPQIGIKEFADSSVNIEMRYWVPTAQYFNILYRVNAAVYKAIQNAGLTIPFPQRDVHVFQPGSNGQKVSQHLKQIIIKEEASG